VLAPTGVHRGLLSFVALAILAHPAYAQPLEDSVAELGADPNAAGLRFAWRGGTRGALGLTVPLARQDAGGAFSLTLDPLIELHEPRGSDQPLPSQFWRGRLALSGARGFGDASRRLRLSLALEHESDHETAHEYSRPGFLALNDIALGAGMLTRLAELEFASALALRLLVASCTTRQVRCADFEGSTALAGGAQLVVGWRRPLPLGLSPFVALAADAVISNDLVHNERRVLIRVGLRRSVASGALTLYGLAWFGNDVGIERERRIDQLGAGIGWTPDP